MRFNLFGLNKSYDSETQDSRTIREKWYRGIAAGGGGLTYAAWLLQTIIKSGDPLYLDPGPVCDVGMLLGGVVVGAAVAEWSVDRAITSIRDRRASTIEKSVSCMDRGELVQALGAYDVRLAVAAGNRLEDIISYQVLPEGLE